MRFTRCAKGHRTYFKDLHGDEPFGSGQGVSRSLSHPLHGHSAPHRAKLASLREERIRTIEAYLSVGYVTNCCVHTVQYTVYCTVYCILYSIQYAVQYTVQYTVLNPRMATTVDMLGCYPFP